MNYMEKGTICHRVTEHLMDLGLSDTEATKAVSDRTTYVLDLAAEDKSNKQIAQKIWAELVNPE